MTSSNLGSHYSADSPISSTSEDLLHRGAFAKAVAQAITSWHGNDSLVVALSGEWGTGKTSIKNLILETIKGSAQILEFNPWQWAGQDLVIEAFFDEVSVAIGKIDKTKSGKKRAAKFKYYGRVLQTAAHAAKGLKGFIPAAIIGITALGYTASKFWTGPIAANLTLIGWIALVIAVLVWGGDMAAKLSDLFEAYGAAHEMTLEERKAELSKSLAKLSKPVLVVIDDIDRLTGEEVRYLLQLVKANANFPHLVFLLLYDRRIVEKFLEKDGFPGSDYLKKIVQVPFDIPAVSRSRIHQILFAQLDRVLSQIKTKEFDEIRWGNLFYGGLNSYFEDLRSVYRFVATFSFHAGLFSGHSTFEVNPIDLIGIETLRVFEPDVYARLRQAKNTITGTTKETGSKEAKVEIDQIIDAAPVDRRGTVKAILKNLFPRLDGVYGNTIYDASSREAWLYDVRVCSPEKFERYFQLSLSENDLSESDLQQLLSSTNSRAVFTDKFNDLSSRGLLVVVLDRLDSYKQKIPIENASEFIPALIDLAEDLPEAQASDFFGPEVRASRVLYWYLKQDADISSRSKKLLEAFDHSAGLQLIASQISNDLAREEKGEKENLLIESTARKKLTQKWLRRVRQIAKNPEDLMGRQSAGRILFRWLDWGKKREVSNWAKANLNSPDMALRLITRLTSRGASQSLGDEVAKVIWNINLDSLEKILPIAVVQRNLKALSPESLSGKEKEAFNAFERAITRREKGAKGDPLFDD